MRHATNTLTLGADKALYIGDIPATGWHSHAAPVLLLGLSGRFMLQLDGDRRTHCHSALIDAGVPHVFDPAGEQVAVMYLEPDAPEVAGLRLVFRIEGPVIVDPVHHSADTPTLVRRLRRFELAALLRPEWVAADPGDRDGRILQSVRRLRDDTDDTCVDRDTAAATVRLSPSRFNHLFSAEAGVSWRSYRIWSQVRRAMGAYRPDGSLTEAALSGAFADAAHFSRMFRQTFGMTPSSVLRPLREVTVLR